MIDPLFSAFAKSSFALCLLLGFFLDVLLGDPDNWPHPIRLAGTLISWTEKKLRPTAVTAQRQLQAGALLALGLPALSSLMLTALLVFLYRLHPWLCLGFRVLMIWKLLALRNLGDEALGVARALRNCGLAEGREHVARIVGRETHELSGEEIIKATVETVAENFSDAVLAPLFYLLLFDLPGMWFYKMVNTQDSMLGYRDERYLYFGRAAARLDDLLNWIPARLSVLFLLLAAAIEGQNPREAFRIWKRDHGKHLSPNAGHPESVLAGALGLRLGGTHRYHGQSIEKPSIGEQRGTTDIAHIDKAVRLLYLASGLSFFIILSLSWTLIS